MIHLVTSLPTGDTHAFILHPCLPPSTPRTWVLPSPKRGSALQFHGDAMSVLTDADFRSMTPSVERDMRLWIFPLIRAEFRYGNHWRTRYSFERRVWFEIKTRSRRGMLLHTLTFTSNVPSHDCNTPCEGRQCHQPTKRGATGKFGRCPSACRCSVTFP